MLWYGHLYMGEKARKHRFSIIRNIRRGAFCPGIYVITPPSNGNNILDIYPAYMLSMRSCRKEELRIMGIADGYQEALILAGTIVSEMYERTGRFCLEEFLAERRNKVR